MAEVIDFTKARRLDFDGYDVPEHTKGTIERYILDRYAPGGFLTAVLANDLYGAIGRADEMNSYALKDICGWIYNRAPRDCWGSYEIVKKYLETPKVR